MRRTKLAKSGRLEKRIHSITIEVDANNMVYFGKTKVFRNVNYPTDFGVWSKVGEERIKDGTMSLSAFRAQVAKKQIFIERNGENVYI